MARKMWANVDANLMKFPASMRLMATTAAAEGVEGAVEVVEAAVAVAAQPVAAASSHYFNYLFTQRKQTCRRHLSCLVITIVIVAVVAYACGICSS